MELDAIEDDVVRLSVPTRFLKSWIQAHYAERVLACWKAELARSDGSTSTCARP